MRSDLSRLVALAVAVVLMSALPASNQTLGHSALPVWPDRSEPSLAKVASALLQALTLARQGRSDREIDDVLPHLRMEHGLLPVELRFRFLTQELVERLQTVGLELEGSSFKYHRAWGRAAPESLPRLAAVPEVTTIHANYPPVLWTGLVDNQADATMKADVARLNWNVDGTGVRVGMISDSFNDLIGGTVTGSGCNAILTGSTPQGTDDLPPAVWVLDNGPGGGSDEGAAQAELIHDVAPGADLMFHTALPNPAAMASAFTDLADCNAAVIVDDVQYWSEPMFQDGIIAQSVDEVAGQGVVVFSSAGNGGTFGVDEIFNDSNVLDDMTWPPTGNDFQQFSNGSTFVRIGLPAGCGVGLVLQWPDPFSGTLGSGAKTDLDLYLCTAQDPNTCTYFSATRQGCGAGQPAGFGDPLEILSITNSGGATDLWLAVDHYCGNENARFRIGTYPVGGGCALDYLYDLDASVFNDAQIYGHTAAQGAISAAAAFYGEIDQGGALIEPYDVNNVEPFSSLGGPIPIYFDTVGDPITGDANTPEFRWKPDITAPDGGNTSFFGQDIGYDADTFPNFFGTSASAPNAAAVAALLLDPNAMNDPNTANYIPPSSVGYFLETTARDIETAGWDPLSGAGVVDANAPIDTASEVIIYVDDFRSGNTSEWIEYP